MARGDSTRGLTPKINPRADDMRLRRGHVDDTTSKLEALAALRSSGALTDAEFAAAKAKLLGQ